MAFVVLCMASFNRYFHPAGPFEMTTGPLGPVKPDRWNRTGGVRKLQKGRPDVSGNRAMDGKIPPRRAEPKGDSALVVIVIAGFVGLALLSAVWDLLPL